jgi:putative tricarboxylic transport membrane protein
MSNTPEKFGTGMIEGVAASEAANNAVVGMSLAPTFALGIPDSGAAMALMGGLMIHGLQPGP